jgi:hypothetical protein
MLLADEIREVRRSIFPRNYLVHGWTAVRVTAQRSVVREP